MFVKNKGVLSVLILGVSSFFFVAPLFSQSPGEGAMQQPGEEVMSVHKEFRSLLEQKEAEGADVSQARELGRQSLQAFQQGNYEKCKRLLEEAIALLKGSLPKVKPEVSEGHPPSATFFAVHLEAGLRLKSGPGEDGSPVKWGPPGGTPLKWQKTFWPHLIRFVETADKYNAKLTLLFHPQWAEYILEDENRLKIVKEWQKNGHEIGLHYHDVKHGDWCGYTNRAEYKEKPTYRGTVRQMMEFLNKLASPEKVVTACIGPIEALAGKQPEGSERPVDEIDYPDEIICNVNGFTDALIVPYKFMYKGKDRWQLRHAYTAGQRELNKAKNEFMLATKPNEVFGFVTHEFNFAQDPGFVEEWFRFVSEHKLKIRTVSDIISEYLKNHPGRNDLKNGDRR